MAEFEFIFVQLLDYQVNVNDEHVNDLSFTFD